MKPPPSVPAVSDRGDPKLPSVLFGTTPTSTFHQIERIYSSALDTDGRVADAIEAALAIARDADEIRRIESALSLYKSRTAAVLRNAANNLMES